MLLIKRKTPYLIYFCLLDEIRFNFVGRYGGIDSYRLFCGAKVDYLSEKAL